MSPGTREKMQARLLQLLQEGDLSLLTPRSLREQLQTEFEVDLSSKQEKQWVKALVHAACARKHSLSTQLSPKKKRSADDALLDNRSSKKTALGEAAETQAVECHDDVEDDPRMPELSADMAAVVGVKHANRFRLIKLLWRYIKQESLQSESNRNVIVCDDKLRKVFDQDTVTSFGMAKLIGKHILKELTPHKEKPRSGTQTGKALKRKTSSPQQQGEHDYRGSPELAAFCGEATNNRFIINKHLWAHIKQHELQDPNDKRRIVFDKTLKDLFGVAESTSFGLAKLVSQHFSAK